MSHLEEEHPEASEYLCSGGFSVQIGNRNPFGRIAIDQACKETVNKDMHTAGGTKRFSLKGLSANTIWLLNTVISF